MVCAREQKINNSFGFLCLHLIFFSVSFLLSLILTDIGCSYLLLLFRLYVLLFGGLLCCCDGILNRHGRVAMAAFVGYCIQSNAVFTWPQTTAGDLAPSIDLLPEEQWDAIPVNARYQIVAVIGFLEFWDEISGYGADVHYMRGRQPGKYPTFDYFRKEVHWIPDLYDPFNINGKMNEEKKNTRLLAEINNGRLAVRYVVALFVFFSFCFESYGYTGCALSSSFIIS